VRWTNLKSRKVVDAAVPNLTAIAAGSSNGVTDTRCCRYLYVLLMMGGNRPKHVEQFPDKINCVTLHLVGYILE
jgi:hypothetical protein